MEASNFGSGDESLRPIDTGAGEQQTSQRPGGDASDPGGGQPKVKGASRGVIEPGTIPKPRATAKPKHKTKRRGRPPTAKEGGETTTRKTQTQTTLNLGEMLLNAHIMLAVLAKNPMIELTEGEAKKLGQAVERVTELYEVPLLDERSRAWINLGLVGFEVYGTRIIATMAEKKPKTPAPVTQIRPHQAHPGPMASEDYREGQVINGQV